ncbi:hypothetical protein D0862_08242 [Hortaea werneckii]|uniref:Mitochondrial import inner membrane translocase subunit TIM23 n=2 Tax=Hortaea werneckii TaxID=91943 RepID=A0A3M7G7I9_HORWE|nr:hypothetical protein D0862_08242 [Hortaea werneckii]
MHGLEVEFSKAVKSITRFVIRKKPACRGYRVGAVDSRVGPGRHHDLHLGSSSKCLRHSSIKEGRGPGERAGGFSDGIPIKSSGSPSLVEEAIHLDAAHHDDLRSRAHLLPPHRSAPLLLLIIIMGIWDAFTGKKSAAQSSSSDTTLQDSAPGLTFNNTTPSSDDVGSFMSQPGAFDPSSLHPLAGLNQDTLDYLTLDDTALSDLPGSRSALPSRGWSDDLCYGTGVTYLAALSIGGAWGLAEGLNRLPATAPPKLRLNSALNAITRRGPFLGNSAGVVAMMYNGINSTIGYYRGRHDSLNSVTAGAISGAIFRSTKGTRPMMISSGICASVAGSWALARKLLFEG